MIIAGTGHRPDRLGYGEVVHERLVGFAERLLAAQPPVLLISGMALGWDTALVQAAQRLGVPYHAYVPFDGQERRWLPPQQDRYRQLLLGAERVMICSEPGYAAWKFDYRNHRMVDDCDRLLALWSGSAGGTANCVGYAVKVGRPVINVWEQWRVAA